MDHRPRQNCQDQNKFQKEYLEEETCGICLDDLKEETEKGNEAEEEKGTILLAPCCKGR